MLVNNFYSSASDPCGISIFSRHLRQALSPFGLDLLETNLAIATGASATPISVLQYVPSGFATPETSRALLQLLASRKEADRLFVILHGLHKYGEDRWLDDTACPDQELHINAILQTAESIIALSKSAEVTCNAWQEILGGRASLLRIDHPGLFELPAEAAASHGFYALLGGISRSKKTHTADPIAALLDACRREGVRVWEHWANVQPLAKTAPAWRRTFGLLSDSEWASLVSHALVVLCPYRTHIQSVSGLVSEALSAQRYVLSTSFDLAVEMNRRYPDLVTIDDDLSDWPRLIRHLLPASVHSATSIPTWRSFAESFAKELCPDRFRMAIGPMRDFRRRARWRTGIVERS